LSRRYQSKKREILDDPVDVSLLPFKLYILTTVVKKRVPTTSCVPVGTSFATYNHPLVTFDSEQKEKLLDEIFAGHGDNSIPE
jgi:hypothetical protein